MGLFTREPGRSELQRALDRELAEQVQQAAEELPAGACVEETCQGERVLFKKPAKQDTDKLFQVNLLDGWSQA